ncbi:MAG: family 20 glycosylhydrolase [Bacteroidales bacterium]
MKKMKNYIMLIMSILLTTTLVNVQAQKNNSGFEVRGLCIAAPDIEQVDRFVKFINEELGPKSINTLILRVDYQYKFKSHPELHDKNALSEKEIKKLVEACRKNKIELIPQINLLGHQSWAEKTGNLLKLYPEFDETPYVKMPDKYEWPNNDNLYCKSYCPLHPGVHKVVFELVDEICDVFESKSFHAGMDEVFYIGEDKCPRCSGHSKAELFAGEVIAIRNHLNMKGRRLWIWGDRLINGQLTGIGMWEASMNNTHQAIDLIPKDVMICDWHYERPDKTAVYFAMKGFDVVTCPWRNSTVAIDQCKDMKEFSQGSTDEMKSRFSGIVQTIWSGAGTFLDEYYGIKKNEKPDESQSACFKALLGEFNKSTE